MLWSYLLVFSDDVGLPTDVHAFIDAHGYIHNWYRWMPNSYVLVSSLTAQGLSNSFRTRFPNGRFVVIDASTDRNGWLPKEAWEMIRNPRRVR